MLAEGDQASVAVMDHGTEAPQNIKNKLPSDPAVPFLVYTQKK